MLTRKKLFSLRTLLHVALAITACSGTSALAQGSAANGATLYVQRLNGVPFAGQAGVSCQDCHGPAGTFRDFRFAGLNEAAIVGRISAAINGNAGQVMGAYSAYTTQRNDLAAHLVAAITPPPPPPLAPLPTPNAQPSPVVFSSTAVGAASATIAIFLSNSHTAAITLGNPHVVPATGQVGDFRSAAVPAGQTACANGAVLQPGANCLIGVQFAPTATGSRTATWNVNFVGNVPMREITLQGTATGPGTSSAPTSSANAPLNAGAGALGWMNLLGLLALLGVSRSRRR